MKILFLVCIILVSGGNGHCELVVIGHSEGPFSSTLHCTSDGFINNFPLHVHGKIQVCIIDRYLHFYSCIITLEKLN